MISLVSGCTADSAINFDASALSLYLNMSSLASFEHSIEHLFSLDYSDAKLSALRASFSYLWEQQEPKILSAYQKMLHPVH